MRHPVRLARNGTTCTIRQQFGSRDYGTEDTFSGLNESPSTQPFHFESAQFIENINHIGRTAVHARFAAFSLYLLWKTCPFVQPKIPILGKRAGLLLHPFALFSPPPYALICASSPNGQPYCARGDCPVGMPCPCHHCSGLRPQAGTRFGLDSGPGSPP